MRLRESQFETMQLLIVEVSIHYLRAQPKHKFFQSFHTKTKQKVFRKEVSMSDYRSHQSVSKTNKLMNHISKATKNGTLSVVIFEARQQIRAETSSPIATAAAYLESFSNLKNRLFTFHYPNSSLARVSLDPQNIFKTHRQFVFRRWSSWWSLNVSPSSRKRREKLASELFI